MTPTQAGSSLDRLERRQCARHQVKSLAYLDIGADNGGIVLNISESGLAVHAVSILPPEPVVDLRIQLPRSSNRLEAKAKVAWTSGTKKEAGFAFIDLPEDVRFLIKEWLALENLEPVYVTREKRRLQSPSAGEPPPTRRIARKDKWTSLVSELMSIPAGIDPVAESPGAPARPVTVTESMHVKETAAPAPLGLDAKVASKESAGATPARDFGLAESLLPYDKQASSESNSITAPDLTDRPVSPNPTVIGDQQFRRSDAELGLPSDKLLRSPLHSVAIVPDQGNETENAKGSQNSQQPDSIAAEGDDFLKRARELFGPKGPARNEPEAANVDSASIANPAEAAPAELPAEDNPKEPALPTPTSDLIPTSTLSGEASVPNSLGPVTAVPMNPDARGEGSKHESTASPPERGLDPRSFLGFLALCVLLSVVCLVLGIVVGRRVAKHSPGTADSRHNGFEQTSQIAQTSQTTPADVPTNPPPNQPAPAASLSQAQKPGLIPAQRSPLEAVPHRTPTASRSYDDAVVSSQSGIDNPAENAAADQSAAKSDSRASSAANASSNEASTIPPPEVSVSASSPGLQVALPPELNAAPPMQPPSDRLVAAHLIYRMEPFYPKEALQQRMEGIVKIHATVGRDGKVKNLTVVSGPASLTSAALDAAQYWRYVPALRNGQPVETDEDISIEFHLPH
jgi:periplasmic protein TonB